MPTWAAIAVSVATPLLTFIGVLLAQLVGRKGAKEMEIRSRREERMRNLRWAAELAVSDDDAKAKLGVFQLDALGDSGLLDDAQQRFVDAAPVPSDEENEPGDDTDGTCQERHGDRRSASRRSGDREA